MTNAERARRLIDEIGADIAAYEASVTCIAAALDEAERRGMERCLQIVLSTPVGVDRDWYEQTIRAAMEQK